MTESFLNGKVTLLRGDCLELLPTLDEGSIDSCVTDPPYHLTSIVKRFGGDNAAPAKEGATGAYMRASKGFMGKQWDGGDIAFRPELWAEVYRVLKPGAHLLAFSGTRTYHRMACAIEDAGFEIRDQIGWCYGSGFPKSHAVDKHIDRSLGLERGKKQKHPSQGASAWKVENGGQANHWIAAAKERGETVVEVWDDNPVSEQAKQWHGWGTALKPAWEPIVLARKPLSESSIAANVLKHGTGAINVDGCRVATDENRARNNAARTDGTSYVVQREAKFIDPGGNGRWPANLIHDGSEEVLAGFPDAPGQQRATGPEFDRNANIYGKFAGVTAAEPRGDTGSAARFFYTAKADADDRLGSKHPTVKPLDLMQYLVRLVTPRGGLVLDPFGGTGTTAEASFREGCKTVLIEREAEYQADIVKRMGLCLSGPDERRAASVKQVGVDDTPLFGGVV